MRTLSTAWQAATMPQTPVTTDVHEALDVGHDFAAQVTFDLVIGFKFFTQGVDIVTSEFITIFGPINTCSIKDSESCSSADAINVGQCDIEPFVSRQIYTN
jgi:hypothetical protein